MTRWEFIRFYLYGARFDVMLPSDFDPAPLKALCPPGAVWKETWTDKDRLLVPGVPRRYRLEKLQGREEAVLWAMITFLGANGWEMPVRAVNYLAASFQVRRAISE